MRLKCLSVTVLALLLISCYPLSAAGDFDRVSGSLITLKMANADPAGVLEMLARQSGNRPLLLPQDFAGKPVTVDFAKTSYWQAIDSICKQEGLVYVLSGNKVFELVPGVDTGGVTSYAGPVVFKIASVSSNHSYWGDRHNDQLSFSASYFWEDRLNSAWTEPVVVEHVTDTQGAELKVRVMDSSPYYALSRLHLLKGHDGLLVPPVPMGGFMVMVQPYPKGLTKVKELSGRVTMGFADGLRELAIDDVMGAGLKTARAAGLEITVTKRERNNKNISMTAAITDGGKPLARLDFGPDQRYGVWLVDKDGKKYPGQAMDQGIGIRVGNNQAAAEEKDPGEGRQVRFVEVPEDAAALRLMWALPKETSTQTYEFKFSDVQVP